MVDCCVRSRGIFYFALRDEGPLQDEPEDDEDEPEEVAEEDIDKHVLVWVRDRELEEIQWSRATLTGFDLPICDAPLKPKPQCVLIAKRSVFSVGSGMQDIEKDIPPVAKDGSFRGSVTKSRVIDGWLYICGGKNSVSKRTDRSVWQPFSKDISNPGECSWLTNGFHDIDGFSETDIYCAGGEGHVYHYDGRIWRPIAFPTNVQLQSLCCAGDGSVYISGMHGVVFKGRGDKWKRVHKADPAGLLLGFHDMVWYDGKVWCTSDYGLWTIENDKLTVADVPSFVRVRAGHLSTADGVLLVAGRGGAAFLENGEWTRIF